jgi:asparagine synthase (glutamine-hydrolysing)
MTLKPNPTKNIRIVVNDKKYNRYPVKTDLFEKGTDYVTEILKYTCKSLKEIISTHKDFPLIYYVIVSEKIIAISQGRSFFIKDIKPSKLAIFLSRFVKKTPHGIGLGSPYTMELALKEVGVLRILLASSVSVFAKLFGISGMFYVIAGRQAASIDGPTSYSLYPSNVSAKLAPKNPEKVAYEIFNRIKISKEFTSDDISSTKKCVLGGVCIIDSNDLGRNVLGNSSAKPDSFFESLMRDNPMGQGREQTPIIIATEDNQ